MMTMRVMIQALMRMTFAAAIVHAQPGLFHKQLYLDGDQRVNAVIQLPDSGFVLVGSTNQTSGGSNVIFLIRTDAAADTLWTKTYPGTENKLGRALAVDDEGNIIIVSSNGGNTTNAISSIIKTDPLGQVLWTKQIQGSKEDIKIGQNGNYYSAGHSSTGRMTLTAISAQDGDSLWQKDYDYDDSWSSRAFSLITAADGGFALIGSWSDGAIGDYVYFVKTDANGEKQWDKLLSIGRGHSVVQTSEGGYLVGGTAGFQSWGSSQASFDYLMQYIESDGTSRWRKLLGISKPNFLEFCESVIQTKSGNLIGAGSGILANYNVNGDSLWAKKLSETGIVISQVLETASGDLLISGIRKDQPVQGTYDYDVFLIITDVEASEFPAWGSSSPTDTSSTVSNDFRLRQNYPNPFNPTTTIEFQLPVASRVTLEIFNVMGQRIVETHHDASLRAGAHTYVWDATDDSGNLVASGVYFYRLSAGDFQHVRKMLLVR